MDKSKLKIKMSNEGLVVYEPERPMTIRLDCEETNDILNKKIAFNKYDEICEIAHLEISNTCNMDCKYCYIKDKKGNELTVDQWKEIINKLVDYGVFQVTFGGGEPTLYDGLIDLAIHANRKGLNVGMTTNGKLLDRMDPRLLRRLFRQINVSWHQDSTLMTDALEYLHDNEIKTGINYCYSKSMVKDNEGLKGSAKHFDAELLYLAYKPVIGDIENVIQPEEIYRVAKEAADEGIKVAVDGPCAGKCMMKKRFCDVDHAGNIYPCSFVRESMGNLLNDTFKNIWKNRGEQIECPFVEINKKEVMNV